MHIIRQNARNRSDAGLGKRCDERKGRVGADVKQSKGPGRSCGSRHLVDGDGDGIGQNPPVDAFLDAPWTRHGKEPRQCDAYPKVRAN